MRTELENLRLALTSPERKSPTTIENYLIAARKFLNFTGNKLPPSKAKLKRFFAQQKENSITSRTQNYYFSVIRKLYQANSWLWPLSKKDRPEISEKLLTTAFTVDEIKTLIKNRGNYSKEECFYLALATTFGMTGLELAKVENKDIKSGKLYIKPIRHGTGRWVVVPGEIMPALKEYHPKQLSRSTLSAIFKRILTKSALEVRRGYGWYSIRITLWERLKVALAQNELPLTLADSYLRLSKGSIQTMYPHRLAATVYKDIKDLLEEPYALDRLVLPIHPFIPLWQD